jgi:hypothetical protein
MGVLSLVAEYLKKDTMSLSTTISLRGINLHESPTAEAIEQPSTQQNLNRQILYRTTNQFYR